ncbi:energy transducer TonB [Mucilaginibacter sp. AW1-3]
MLGSNINIFRSEWLNVVFAGRNQAYGAYELRRENPRNTNRALIIAIAAFIFLLATPTIVNWAKGFIPKADEPVKVTVVTLPPPPMLEKKKIIPPPRQEAQKPHTTEIRFPPPVVRPDQDVREKDPPKDIDLLDKNPGQKDLKGDANMPIDLGEKEHGNSTEKVVTEAVADPPFIAVEVNPEYPGGESAFGKFLQKNIRYPSIAKENGIQGKAYLQFIVERDGSLTDIKSLRDPGSGLGEEAIRVLKMSPHWKPGVQNGKPVRVQYTIPVNFSLGDQ